VTPTSIQSVGIEGHVMPSTPRPEPHNMPFTQSVGIDGHVMPSTPRPEPHNMPSTSNVGLVSILPPGPEQVSLRSLIDSQTRMLRLLPDIPANVQIRQERIEQIQLWEMSLLESVLQEMASALPHCHYDMMYFLSH